MTFAERLRGVAVAVGLLLALAPLAVVVALFSMPLLRWAEAHFTIEVVGHSGPAEWVFLVIYFVLVILATIIWRLIEK